MKYRHALVAGLALVVACGEEPVAPDLAFGKSGGGGAAPNPEIVYRQIERKGIAYYVINADGSSKALVASGIRAAAEPSWSRQGAGTSAYPYRFAWGDADPVTGQGCELFVTDVVVSGSTVAGRPRMHIPTTPKNALHPDQSLACHIAWSPVGPEVAYATGSYAGASGGPELWIVSILPAPAADRRVYAGARPLGGLAWSRDGSHIVVQERSSDYAVAGDRLLLVEVATGDAIVLVAEPANWELSRPEFANLSNDLLYRRTPYSCGCSTPNCCPDLGEGSYRLPLDANYLPGTAQPLIDAVSASWAPDDASFVGEYWGGGIFRFSFATGMVTNLVSQGKVPDSR